MLDNNEKFWPSVTDSGVCYVYNGNSFDEIFNGLGKLGFFLNTTKSANGPLKFNASGSRKDITFLLNIGDRHRQRKLGV